MHQQEKPIFAQTRSSLPSGTRTVDLAERTLKELFFIRNPNRRPDNTATDKQCLRFIKANLNKCIWVYYPWKKFAVRIPPENWYFELRTDRNRNIIAKAEQRAFRALSVGIAGLSVGSAILHSLVRNGGPKKLKIADPDTIGVSNLNRLSASLPDAYQNKAQVAAYAVWEVDPFAQISAWHGGITERTLKKFILGRPKLDVFIDEMDNIKLKFIARRICKKVRIPVLMATDNGDGVLMDIERYDTEPNHPMFHGYVPDTDAKELEDMDKVKWLSFAIAIIRAEDMTEEHQASLLRIGTELSAPPRISTAGNIGGAAVAFALRRIAAKKPLKSGRYRIDLEEHFIPGYNSKKKSKLRAEKTKKINSLIFK